MSRRILFVIIISFFIGNALRAQDKKYWVFLKDKKRVTFDPFSYFDKKTIERRLQYGIPLVDSTDFPLNNDYVNTICKIADSTSNSSRWFNAMSVYATESEIAEISKLYFVNSVSEMKLFLYAANFKDSEWDTVINHKMLEILAKQTERMGGNYFQQAGVDGKGIRIAIFDGGFPTVDTNPAFEHIRKAGKIIKTWDFAKNKEFVYGYMSHGTMVLSCSAGIYNGKNIGLATSAEFLLARTEIQGEYFSEEESWLAAVEWADKNGADIINSSLGYTNNRYFPSQMDGKTTLVTRAANLAAKKGILVVNAAGNDGDDSWKIVGAPADADSTLSVGGINPETDIHISFSSYGPTWDKRLKPNVCAYGSVTAVGKNKMVSTQGTSFASPLVAGFAACAWQINRGLNNMQMFQSIEESGDLFPYFDYAHGYGVPQAQYFLGHRLIVPEATFDFVVEDGFVKVIVKPEFIDKKFDTSKGFVFYNIQNANGVLQEYSVISVLQKEVLKLNLSDYKKGQKLNVHLENYTKTFEF